MKGSKESISVLLVDDHHILRDGLKSYLEKDKAIAAIYEAGNGQAAIYQAQRYHPDIVIMDINLPDGSGIEVTRQILNQDPAIKVLCLSMHTDKLYVTSMMKAGASGFLTKTCSARELSLAIHKVVSGIPFLCDEVIQSVIDMVRHPPDRNGRPPDNPLSRREAQVLKMIAEGHTSANIAEILSISRRTVEQHRKNIIKKLGIKTTAKLTKFAIRQGLTFVE